jgi:hypothetical protein
LDEAKHELTSKGAKHTKGVTNNKNLSLRAESGTSYLYNLDVLGEFGG